MDLAELRQAYVPTQHYSHPVDDRQVKFIVSDQEGEADYHHHINPHIVPSDANRRPGRLPSPSRDLQDVIHDPRYIPRQHERIFPSVEDRFQPRVSNDFDKNPSKSAPEPTIFVHREQRTPRIINFDGTEGHAAKNRRINNLAVLSPEMSTQTSRDYHQEEPYLISHRHDNEWSGSRQNHTAFVHQLFPDSLPREDPSKLVHHADARGYSDRQRPVQILKTHMDVAGQPSHIVTDGRERPPHHERVEVPLLAPSAVGKPQAFLDSTHKSANFSQSSPALQHPQKKLPVLHGSFGPHVTSHRDRVQSRREPVNLGGLDVFTSSPARFDDYGQGMQIDLAGQSIRPEYRRLYFEGGHGGFDANQKAYLIPQNDPHDVHGYEKPRTGIFLREVPSGRQSIPDGSMFRPIEIQSSPLPKYQSSQRLNPDPVHGIMERENEMSAMETSRGKPILEHSRPDSFRRYVSGHSLPC